MISLIIILLFVNGAFEIMKKQLTTSFIFPDIIKWIGQFVDHVEKGLSSTENLHLLAIILVALVGVTIFFALLLIVVHILSFIFFRKKGKRSTSEPKILKEETISEEKKEFVS